MTLEQWLVKATANLAAQSAAQVRTEIASHYESALDAALAQGASTEAAHLQAIESLGSPATANRQYQKALLTQKDADLLSRINGTPPSLKAQRASQRAAWLLILIPIVVSLAAISEGRKDKLLLPGILVACGIFGLTHSRLKQVSISSEGGRTTRMQAVFELLTLSSGFALLQTGYAGQGRLLLSIGGISVATEVASRLPIYTKRNSKICRALLFAVWIGAGALMDGPRLMKDPMILVGWPVMYLVVDYPKRALRRKLPIEAWPKQLYL